MIRISLRGVSPVPPGEVERLRAEFAERRCVSLPGLLAEEVQERVRQMLATADFSPRQMPGIGQRAVAAAPPLRGLLSLLVQKPEFLAFLEAVTGQAPLRGFDGNVNRLEPGTGHHLDWHRDSGDPHRRIGMSIHLGEPFEGGRFQVRDRKTAEVLWDRAATGPGEATVFALDDRLEHRVTPVTGTSPRTALVGWFLDEPYRGFAAKE